MQLCSTGCFSLMQDGITKLKRILEGDKTEVRLQASTG
jgi:hypothetical protein